MSNKLRYRGRIAQIGIYLGKLFRMFIYQNDWKVLPMAALIAGLVTFAVGNNIFKTQEGTLSGCFSLVCVCVWNGFFNSIQVVCRERPIIKREHRAGMHISSYLAAHMIYQMFLCVLQTAILIGVCRMANMQFPEKGLVTGNFTIDLAISLFLITYVSDILSLAISCLVHNTTTAMTVMPFMLIFQLIFSGGLIPLEGFAQKLTNLTITKWGLNNLCTLGDYNSQGMVTLWNTVWKFREMEIEGTKPIKLFTDEILRKNMLDQVLLDSGKYNTVADYTYAPATIYTCWRNMVIIMVIAAVVSVLLLKSVDKDRR